MNEKMTKKSVICIMALICCFLWGSAFPCIKIGYELFRINTNDVYSVILFAGIRFTIAGIMTIAMGCIINKKLLLPKKTSIVNIINLSIFQTVLQYFFFYVGLVNTTGVKASIIEASNVFIALITVVILKMEKLTKRKVIGCILGFLGVIIINLGSGEINISFSLNGEGFILISTIAYAISSVLLKKYSKTESPVVLSGYQFVLGGIILSFAGLLMGGKIEYITYKGCLMLIYLAIISALAYTLWGTLLKYNPVGKVAVYGFMNPVFGVILSYILLNEGNQVLGINALISLILVCVGIYTVNSTKNA